MTKQKAIYTFLSSFGLPAYREYSVPDDANPPYIVYEGNVGNAGDPTVMIAANVYMPTTSDAAIESKVAEIADAIGRGGRMLSHGDGAVWIRRGTPWSISVEEPDPFLKRRQLNISLEFI